MNRYRRYLRAYAWVLVTTFLVVGLLRAHLNGYDQADLEGWQMLPESCETPIACTPANPTR